MAPAGRGRAPRTAWSIEVNRSRGDIRAHSGTPACSRAWYLRSHNLTDLTRPVSTAHDLLGRYLEVDLGPIACSISVDAKVFVAPRKPPG